MELWLIFMLLSAVFSQVFADYCGDRIFCDAPFKCCETKKDCCYDSMLQNNRHFRLQIWNMWYFWFLIIFMIMSCFGGCGYYRRRRLAMLTRASNPPQMSFSTMLEPVHRGCRGRNNDGAARHFNFFAYIGPGVSLPEPASNLPPAYSEVVNQPGQYPFTKMELPPYPGDNKPEDGRFAYAPPGSAVLPHQDAANQPPPYSEYYPSPAQPPFPPSQNDTSSQYVPLEGRVEQVPAVPAEAASARLAGSTMSGGSH